MSRQTETSLSKGCRTNMNLNKLSIVWRRYLLIVRVYCCRTVRTSVDPGASKPLSIITVADKLATYNLTCNHCLADKHSFFSERELTFTCAICCRPSVRLSVVCLSVVCNARAPYSGSCNFRQSFYGVWYLGDPLTCTENFMQIVPGEPLRQGS